MVALNSRFLLLAALAAAATTPDAVPGAEAAAIGPRNGQMPASDSSQAMSASSSAANLDERQSIPPSNNPLLKLPKRTPTLRSSRHGRKKGKGLVASEDIAEGEVVWKEDPFVLAPEWCALLF